MEPILTGSAEFWPDEAHDRDWIEFRPQEPVFAYHRGPVTAPQEAPREGGPEVAPYECRFCYREGLTKEEYFKWHREENTWHLNFAPLITKQFLDAMKIDPLGADKDEVLQIIERAFRTGYNMPERDNLDEPLLLSKWIYRIYIYICFVENNKLELTDQQLKNANGLYRQEYKDPAVLRTIYEFFHHAPELTERSIRKLMNPAPGPVTEGEQAVPAAPAPAPAPAPPQRQPPQHPAQRPPTRRR